MTKGNKVRIGIIGCGQIARIRHVPELVKSEHAELSGFYDYIPDHAEVMAKQYGGRVYERYEDMLEETLVDGVVICTSNDSHGKISVEALKHNKFVLCEKPMCMSLEEAKMVVEAEKESKAFYMAAHNQRFTLAHRKAKEILESGQMGRVLSFRCTLAHTGPENFSVNRSTSTWYLSKKSSGFGCVTDLGIHKCDVIRYVLGETFTRVAAIAGTRDKRDADGNFVDVYDNAVCVLETGSGIMGTLNLSYSNYGPMENGMYFYCEHGALRIHNSPDCALEIMMKSGERTCYFSEPNPCSNVVDTFAAAIQNQEDSPVAAQEAYEAMRVVFAIEESSRTGKFVEI